MSTRNPGIIIESKGQRYIVYNDQPLLKTHGKLVLHWVDNKNNLIHIKNGLPLQKYKTTIIKKEDYLKLERKHVGYVD